MAPNIKDPITEEDWIACIPLPEYLAKIPLGHVLTIAGDEFWIDGNGEEFPSADEYKANHGCDPAVVWAAKKKYLATVGRGVHYA